VGIDVARTNDSTVVSVVWVDWDHPDGFGFYEHRVLNWLEINNTEWEQQYFEIIDFLRNYEVYRIGVDAQGVGGAVAERLQILMPQIEVTAISSDAKAQNERWVHLTELIQREQLIIPGHSKARRTRVWKKFNQQMSDLEKVYRGPYLLAAAPDEKGAFDDFPDSLAIACSLSVADTMPVVTVSESPFFGR
jgi:phage FluMu gp28-like protein